jgi:hypothetical protein
MKKALAGVLVASLLGLVATGAMAQVPNFQVYFDANFHEAQVVTCGAPLETIDLYVVMNNFNTIISGANFSIDFPQALLYNGETYPPATLNLGNANSADPSPGLGGELVGFGLPQNGFQPILVTTVHCYWSGVCDCGPQGTAQPVVVRGYKYADGVNGSLNPEGVEAETYNVIPSVGMTSLICGPVSTQESTWGAVKALYR